MNPYDPDKVAESIHAALAMPVRTVAGGLNVYWWAGCNVMCHFGRSSICLLLLFACLAYLVVIKTNDMKRKCSPHKYACR